MSAAPGLWPLHDVHAAFTEGLRAAAAAVEEEQAVRGLDARGEVELHALLAEAAASSGFGVTREVRYPGEHARGRRSEGVRCDLVLTPAGTRLDEQALVRDLFRLAAPEGVCPLGEALWVEVKRVAQFGEERARSGYGAALQGPIWRDLAKLGADPRIEHAAQVILLFTAAAEVAAHDLSVSLDRAWSRGLRLDTPLLAHLPIGDRFGNACLTVALVRLCR